MSGTSREKVLDTPELLEAILGFLDIRSLLTSAQLVNHAWHSLVTHSPALQRALYLRPDATERTGGDLGLNPLLAETFPCFFFHRPALDDRPAALPPVVDRGAFASLPWAADPLRAAALLRPGASWRRMLTRQPPARRVGRCRRSADAHGHGDAHYAYDAAAAAAGGHDGLRMGALYDLVADRAARAGWGGCGVFWAPAAFLGALRAAARPSSARPPTARARALVEARAAMTGCVDVVVEVSEWWGGAGMCGPVAGDGAEEEAARERLEFDRRFRHPDADAEQLMEFKESV